MCTEMLELGLCGVRNHTITKIKSIHFTVELVMIESQLLQVYQRADIVGNLSCFESFNEQPLGIGIAITHRPACCC